MKKPIPFLMRSGSASNLTVETQVSVIPSVPIPAEPRLGVVGEYVIVATVRGTATIEEESSVGVNLITDAGDITGGCTITTSGPYTQTFAVGTGPVDGVDPGGIKALVQPGPNTVEQFHIDVVAFYVPFDGITTYGIDWTYA